MNKKLLSAAGLTAIICILLASFTPGTIRKPVYLNTSYSFEERAADLVSRMTLEEKQSLLGNNMPAIPRLGVNPYNVWGEALHGYASFFNPEAGPATSFPNSVAVGASWDPELVKREASAIADEARGFNYPVINGLTFWSPVVEAMRDPRWGRTGESYGEDPYLIAQIAGGFIRGLMGEDKKYLKAVPTGKHYFANNSEFNRHISSSDIDKRDMREFYLASYKKLIEKDKLPSIMTCYNAVNGVPVTANRFLVDSIARKTYGMKGYVTGDCGAVADVQTGHFYAKTSPEAAAMGLKAGVDTDCGSVYQTSAIDAIKQGLISEADIDLALVNMFTIRMRIGEFDPKAKVPHAHIGKEAINSPGHVALAEEVATKTPVLLKNNTISRTGKKALPLKAGEIKKIAVLGPQADKVELGPYSGRTLPENMITPLSGIKDFLKRNNLPVEVVHSAGANTISSSNLFNVFWFELVKNDGKTIRYDANKFTSSSKGIISSAGMTPEKSVKNIKDGNWTSYSDIDISGVAKINIGLTVPGDGGIVEVRLDSENGKVLAVIEAKPGQGLTSSFMTRTITGDNRIPEASGKQNLFLVYRSPAAARAPADREAIEMAATADVALLFVGTDDRTANEEADRLDLRLPGNQYELIKAVAEVNPYTIVVMQTLGMVEVEQFKNIPNVAGIIWTGFNGQAQGKAIARILFGDVVPGGKLNATWFKSLDDIPEITDYTLRGGPDKNGRTYWYFNKDVSYEFGYGLSYTTFEYSNFGIDKKSITPNDRIRVSVDVKNTGDFDGDEVVQVYVRTPDSPASLQRPIKRLKGFQRITIPAGQTRTVTIDINCADLWFWDPENNKINFDQGRYVFEIGSSSRDIKGQVEALMSGSFISELKTVVAECGKVVIKPGNSAQTSVTAAMTDDSFYDIKKAKVTYKSNNPSVASVDQKGLVTARNPGTATITASVTIEGKTLSGSYPLKVMPDLRLSRLTLNDKRIPGFNPAVRGYSYLVSSQSARVPKIATLHTNEDVTVATLQAEKIPGTAVVTLTDNITSESNEYVVSFGTRAISDEFSGKIPGRQWKWIRENSTGWSMTKTPGWLELNLEKGDIQGNTNDAVNILLQDANTDWTAETTMQFSDRLSVPGQKAGIVAYQDDDNYVMLVRDNTLKGFMGIDEYIELIYEKNGAPYSSANFRLTGLPVENNQVALKLVKKGSTYTAYYNIDGKGYRLLGSTDVTLRDVKAGLLACNGSDAGMSGNILALMMGALGNQGQKTEVKCDYFRITSTGLNF